MIVSFHILPNSSVTLLFAQLVVSFENVSAFYWPTKNFAAACNVVETVFRFGRCSLTITLADIGMAYDG
jgi:hypothetical protein